MTNGAARARSGTRRRRALRLSALALIVLALGVVGYRAVWALGAPAPGSGRQVLVVVNPGMDVAQISRRLHRAGLIRSPLAFRLLARQGGVGGDLQAGTYALSPAMAPRTILRLMAEGKVTVRRVTIPEGWDGQQVAQAVTAALPDAGDVTAVFANTALLGQAGLPLPAAGVRDAMEGYLFPATYTFAPSTTATTVVRAMLARFQKAWTPRLRAAAAAQGLDTAQAVTLASIVQREVSRPADMRVVAGIYQRRLQRHMPLDADPTVLYALDLLGEDTRLTLSQLAVDSPYNTYRYPGLPPGPICNPGLAALQAVTDPTPGQSLYFLTTPSGQLVVADTLQQQLANRRKYLGY